MGEFLYGEALSAKIREVLQGNDPCCAVAFWGSGAVQELFGNDQIDFESLKVVCDLSMGGTNPETLMSLGAPNNANLRHFSGLHSKVYISTSGVVITSANASNNGIGFMGADATLIEAGAFFEDETDEWFQSVMWFQQEIWTSASPIDTEALEAARLSWNRRNGAENGFRGQNTRDFLNYDSTLDGLVYPLWYTEADAEGDHTVEVHREFGPVNIEYTTHLSRHDAELRGNWVCSYRVNANGYVDGRLRPRFFYANSLIIDGAREIDPAYANVLGQSPHAIVAERPFDFGDFHLIAAFRAVINDPEGPYAPLRGELGAEDETWLARDHVELMHRFWRDVQDEYRRLQNQA